MKESSKAVAKEKSFLKTTQSKSDDKLSIADSISQKGSNESARSRTRIEDLIKDTSSKDFNTSNRRSVKDQYKQIKIQLSRSAREFLQKISQQQKGGESFNQF